MSDRQRPYIGIVSAGDIHALRRLAWASLPPFGYRWMAGVLVSAKTLAGEATTNARYPRFDDVPALLAELGEDSRTWPVVHFNCREGLAGHLRTLAGLTAMRGLQLNVQNPDRDEVAAFKRDRPDVEFILQVNAAAADESGAITADSVRRYVDRYDGVADFALVDASAGRGKAVDLAVAQQVAAHRPGMAFAGGLGPDSEEQVATLCAAAQGLSFDAESRVRRPLAHAVEGVPYQDRLDPAAAFYWVKSARLGLAAGSLAQGWNIPHGSEGNQ